MKSAFTLIEVLIVVLILGILATISIPMMQGAIIKAKLSGMLVDVNQIEKAIMLCDLERGWSTVAGSVFTPEQLGNLGYDVPNENPDFRYKMGLSMTPGDDPVSGVGILVRTKEPNLPLCLKVVFPDDISLNAWYVNKDHPWFKPTMAYIKGAIATPLPDFL